MFVKVVYLNYSLEASKVFLPFFGWRVGEEDGDGQGRITQELLLFSIQKHIALTVVNMLTTVSDF
jgi:hypothetical protein